MATSRPIDPVVPPSDADAWRSAAMAMLAVRFVQGWIFWGGGSRRFIYAPSKLDPNAPVWMANKFQSAMPGAILGMDRIVDYMLHHFSLLYAGVIAFSAAELVFGLFLIIGFMTRLSAFVTIGFSFILMLLFGWQGATCLDEWTMAVCNFAMGVTLFITGSGAYSADSWMARHRPVLMNRAGFQYLASGTRPAGKVRQLGLLGAVTTILFTVLTYNHYRGAVFTAFHEAPVSPSEHHFSLSDGQLSVDGAVRVTAYLDAGTPDVPATIVRAELTSDNNQLIESWDGAALAALPNDAYVNDYPYNQFRTGYSGISARMGARAKISLPPAHPGVSVAAGEYTLTLYNVDGRSFKLRIREDQT